ncbi:MAG: PD-(D/E)XK nuclease family transposase [Lachnospiraceae bacterium]|nr:PD-(D/E)XK nuclease family transposase [Lachnospiraceae bacterium]
MPEDDNVLSWIRFFSGKKAEDFQTMANDTDNEYINEACQTLFELSADEKKRLEYEAREKAIRDYNAGMNYARKQGIAEGKAQGIAEGKAQGIAEGKAQGIAEGKAQGIAEGKAQGITEGKAQGKEDYIRQLIHTWSLQHRPVSEMAELLNIPEDRVLQIQAEDGAY